MDLLRSVHRHTRTYLNQYLDKIEEILKADVLTIFSPKHRPGEGIHLFRRRCNSCHSELSLTIEESPVL